MCPAPCVDFMSTPGHSLLPPDSCSVTTSAPQSSKIMLTGQDKFLLICLQVYWYFLLPSLVSSSSKLFKSDIVFLSCRISISLFLYSFHFSLDISHIFMWMTFYSCHLWAYLWQLKSLSSNSYMQAISKSLFVVYIFWLCIIFSCFFCCCCYSCFYYY